MTNTKSLSRRGFAKILGAGAAYTVLRPSIVLSSTVLRLDDVPEKAPSVVRLSSNENPYGPSPAALKAMTDGFGLAWRYPDEHQDELVAELAKLNNVSPDYIQLGAGSGEILKLAAVAYAGPTKKLVTADPTFEAIGHHASVSRAQIAKVRLAADYSHDLPKMLDAAGDAGLVYICNPNNPTASITPKGDMRAFLAKVPRHTMVLVDEAYSHFADAGDFESAVRYVKEGRKVIVARTFSKIYGLAGMRVGYAIATKEIIDELKPRGVHFAVSSLAALTTHILSVFFYW